jgi:hypothetical protein
LHPQQVAAAADRQRQASSRAAGRAGRHRAGFLQSRPLECPCSRRLPG